MQRCSPVVAPEENRHKMKKKEFFMGKRDTRLVVEQDTVYELDMDCVRSRRRQKKTCQKIQKKEKKVDKSGKRG